MVITSPQVVFTDALLSVANADITIINHKTACGAQCTATQVAQSFGQPPDYKSVHFVVGRDGSVIQVVRLKDGAGGNCCVSTGYNAAYYDPLRAKYGQNCNLFTISIEHEDWTTDNSQPMTPEQIAASNALNLWLCQRYGIGPANIHSHASIDPVNRSRCPGPTFDFNQLFAYIQAGGNVTPTPSPFDQEASDCWNSWFNEVAKLQGTTPNPPPQGTGIFNSWKTAWTQGHQYGCPLTWEYNTVDGNGNNIIAQQFAGGRCEWRNNSPFWYTA